MRHFEHVKLLLYGSSPIPAWEPAATFLTTAVNEMAMVSLLQSLQPDVLLVVGGPVLKPHIFGIPRLATINVHFGIAPYYRGEHTLFWPLYYRDYSNLGVTIHLIDRGIDTGNILAQEFLQVTGDDTPATLEAKAAQAGADLVNELLRQGDFTAHRQPALQTRGRQFNFSSRRVWHDLLYYARRRWLAERPQETSASRVNYCGAGWEINPQPVVLSLANGFQCEQRETIH